MGRWAPGASGRLQEAAFSLYAAQGFEETTVAQIAEAAGVTERTFFRYYADKREVLFAGSDALLGVIVAEVGEGTPMEQVVAALSAAAALLTHRGHSRQRQAIISANPVLQERELIKMATWSAALRALLVERGVPQLEAGIAAETGVAVFRVAFEQWLTATDKRTLVDHVAEGLSALATGVGSVTP